MKHILTLLALSAAASAVAQPILTFNGNAPQTGTSYERRFSPYIAPGPGGAGQVWDLSSLTTDSTAMVSLVDPSTTAYGAQYPAATVAEVSDGSTVYFQATPNGVVMLGYEADDLPVVFNDGGRFMSFPCSHQTTWTDTYGGTFQVEGSDVELSGTITGTADGHGTLILPTGSIPNVLRVHWVQEEEMSMGMFTFTTVFNNHLYYVPGQSYPVVQTTSATSEMLGNTIVTEFTQWTDDLTTGTPEADATHAALQAFPVPTSGELNFTIPAHFSGTPLITVTDATGRIVRGVRSISTRGTEGRMDVSALPAGVYQCTAIDELGQRATARFIVR
ncbi:MAG: T9SS type A sorting domain-containing protein [Flavobacteriales bacterium]|nr:hypothetical protein [Flavobacteriales bacterium]MCC6575703.1 T9SS type A sorting domain-containing protein [Flavobacteriales bacterium]NUQ13812.1 T9SS type A sorting domain-containing protein [Flavobacteriales bacterium]